MAADGATSVILGIEASDVRREIGASAWCALEALVESSELCGVNGARV